MFDAYLILTGVKGECRDKTMAAQGAMALLSFDVGSTKSLFEASQSREKAKAEKAREQSEKSTQEEDWPDDDFSLGREKSFEEVADDPEHFAFQITKYLDSASPSLFKAYLSALNVTGKQVFKKATVLLRRSGGVARAAGQTYLKFEFEEVSVAYYEMKTQGNDRPTEDVQFRYFKQTMYYYPQLKDGSNDTPVIAGWDAKQYSAT